MANTYSQLYIHLVFAVKKRNPLIPKEHREGFSMLDIKTMYFNQYITELIFSKLALDLSCEKIRQLYEECLSIGRLAA